MRIVLAGALLAASAFGAANTPIADIAMKGDMDSLRALIKQHPGDVNAGQPDGSTALLWAAYWNDDTAVDALGEKPLAPFKDAQELIKSTGSIFNKLDRDFSLQFQEMNDLGLLDLASRRGKAPGVQR